ncbi:MAG: LPS export ABC transporter ATP-binding protein [Deltaproteobacteria bacterium RIFCSPHIGHO2_12_FULL_43_9]|nr:MAG: LPS export ABC transporter ATP-binding protein [Deltaproteobacteria bacterium RIFCSPHIGHO2_12_FULL_43_9]
MAILETKGLVKSYGDRTVVKNVDLSVHAGKIIGLLGPNGAGKTTCFYSIVGLITPDDGEVLLDGINISKEPMYKRARLGISYLPQEPSIFKRLSARENILAVLEGRGFSAVEMEQIADSLLEELNVSHLANNKAYSLSGGETRRVEIARALATKPKFILLDEPFAGIDPIAVLDIQSLVRGLKNRQIGVLITDHNVRETLGICDEAYLLKDGEIIVHGSASEIAVNPLARQFYLGEGFEL